MAAKEIEGVEDADELLDRLSSTIDPDIGELLDKLGITKRQEDMAYARWHLKVYGYIPSSVDIMALEAS